MPEIATYQVRGIFIRYAIDHFGWARKDAADAFDQWLEQRREVAMTNDRAHRCIGGFIEGDTDAE